MGLALGAGWLAQDLSLPAENHGVLVPRWSALENAPFPTRTEEYWWLAASLEAAERGTVLDAGSGFNPEIHLAPYILGNMGFDVLAVDQNPLTMQMPPHQCVTRAQGDICALSELCDNAFSYWICISTLEHMTYEEQHDALLEAKRLLKPGGHVLVTTDETEPERVNTLLQCVGLDVGPIMPQNGTMLSPRVAWAIARKS